MNIQQLLTCSEEALVLMPPSYEEVGWELQHDFIGLALLGPRIYRSNGESHSHVFVVWDEYMLQKTQVFEKTCLLKDFGEGKRKIALGVLPLDNIPTFEGYHKIKFIGFD
jgi:hypothetical protein